jgi:hypothetical protein
MKAKVTITKVTSNVEDDRVDIEIVMNKKHIRLKMNPYDFALCLLGLGRQEATVVHESLTQGTVLKDEPKTTD